MKNGSLRNPIMLALAVRPALATFSVAIAAGREDFYADFMRYGLVLVDTILFAWLTREVYLLKDAGDHEADNAELTS